MKRNRFLAACSCNLGRYCRLHAPRIWTVRRRLLPDLRNQNPRGYRHWELISVAHEAGDFDDLRAMLGTYRNDGFSERDAAVPGRSIIARLAWKYVPSAENNKVFGRDQSFIAGPATNVQFMVKGLEKVRRDGRLGVRRIP